MIKNQTIFYKYFCPRLKFCLRSSGHHCLLRPVTGAELVWAAQIAPTHFNYCRLLLSSTPRAGPILCNYKCLYCSVNKTLTHIFLAQSILFTPRSVNNDLDPFHHLTSNRGSCWGEAVQGVDVSLLVMMIMRAMIARPGPRHSHSPGSSHWVKHFFISNGKLIPGI